MVTTKLTFNDICIKKLTKINIMIDIHDNGIS